jgi:hypothetical protein
VSFVITAMDRPDRRPSQWSSHRVAHWQLGTAGAFSLLDSARTSIAAGLRAAASALRVVARSFLSLVGSASMVDPEACDRRGWEVKGDQGF